MKSLFTTLVLCLLVGTSTVTAQWSSDLITTPERTSYTETSTYADVMEYIQAILTKSDLVHLEYMGTSLEGKQIPVVVMANPKISTPQQAVASGKPVMYIQGNIHGGEVEGKEALQVLMREILLGDKKHLLDNQIILFAPIYNSDSNDKMDAKNRPSQENSPLKAGLRSNSQGWDLNRDGIKMEALETNGLVQNVLNKWNPEVLVDLHTTNGTWHGYSLTWAPSYQYAGEPGPYNFTWNRMLPEITQVAKDKYDLHFGPYGWYRIDQGWPPKAIYTYNHHPRYMVNQMGLRNKIGILSEAFSHERLYQRIYSTHAFVTEILNFTNKNGYEIARINKQAEDDAIANVKNNAGKVKKGVRFKMVPLEDTFTLRTYDYTAFTDDTGKTQYLRSPNIIDVPDVQNYSKFEATVESTLPRGYLIPAELKAIAEHLQKQGATVQKLTKKVTAKGELFEITALNKSPRAFEGHNMATAEGEFKPATRAFKKGDYWIDLAQPLANLIFYTLEPQSDDGLVTWNFFDEYLESKGVNTKNVEYPVFKYFELK